MKKSIAYIGGTFDLFHVGHLRLFKHVQLREGYRVHVSLNTDEFAARYKRRPVVPLLHRMEMLLGCKHVDSVGVNTGDEDSRPAILASGARVIVHGDDWTGAALMKQMGFDQAWLDAHRLKLLYLPYTRSISTSGLIGCLLNSAKGGLKL